MIPVCVYLCQDSFFQLHSFSFLRLKTDDLVVDFLIENNSVNVVKQTEQMSLRDREKYDPNNKQRKQYRKEGKRRKIRLIGSRKFNSNVCYLYSVRVRGLAQNLQQGGIRHEEETRKHQTLLLQVTRQRLLTELQILQEVREDLEEEERRSWSESRKTPDKLLMFKRSKSSVCFLTFPVQTVR